MSEDKRDVWAVKLAVQEVIHRYSDSILRKDWDAYEALFTEDGVWEAAAPLNMELLGAKAVRDTVSNLTSGAAFFLQQPLSIVVDVVGDGQAKASTLVQEIVRGGGEEADAMVIYGVCSDELVETDAGWKISKRHFQPLFMGNAPMPGNVTFDRGQLA